MRICYLVSQYPSTSHTFIRREVDELRRLGLDVQTFSVRPPQPGECTAQSDRLSEAQTFCILKKSAPHILAAHLAMACKRPTAYVRTLVTAVRHRPPGLRAFLWAFFYFAEAIVLAQELARRKIKHVHNHFGNAGAIVGLLASEFLDLPWSLTLHGVSETDYPAGLLLPEKIKRARFVACASHFVRAQAMRVTPSSEWSKFVVVRCGLDLTSLRVRTAPSRQARPTIICVGRLSPEKGHLGLLESVATMRAEGMDVTLVLVGHGPERARIEQAIDALGLRDCVRLEGRLAEEDTLHQISKADALVLASFMEGLPVVLMEAMALGTPVVATRVAGIPELITEEREGLLFRPADWHDLAEKLTRVLRNQDLSQELAAAARRKVEAEFSIETAGQILACEFQKVLGAKRAEESGASGSLAPLLQHGTVYRDQSL